LKKIIVGLMVFGMILFAGNTTQGKKQMKMFQSVPVQKAVILQKGKTKMFCPKCGMTLPMFYKTNHVAIVDGKVKQFCSMHCLVEASLEHKVVDIKVVDVKSLKFIDAKSATYVVGSSKKGTMTMNSKYAFASKDDAQKFAKKFSGKIMTFDEAYAIALKAFAKEKKMITKRQAMMAKKGKMIYEKMCKKTDLGFSSTATAKAYLKMSGICGNIKGKKLQAIGIYLGKRNNNTNKTISLKKKTKKLYPMGKRIFEKKCNKNINPTNYSSINELKADIKNNALCKPLKKKQLYAVCLYLWDVKRFGDIEKTQKVLKVQKTEKCPVCGMFVYKYPRWVAQIFYKHNNHEHHYSFDGVKDMMKFYLDAREWGDYKNFKRKNITKILVTDYYSQKAIDARNASFVIGSDVYGPMGNELIPFKNKADAKSFYMDHKAKKIIKFSDISKEKVYQLDE